MISFKNLILEGENAFLLSENNIPLAKCVFSDSPPKIIEIIRFSSCKQELLVTLVRSVLNHFDLKGEKLVMAQNGMDESVLHECGFSRETGEGLYGVDLTGYFVGTCCEKDKRD